MSMEIKPRIMILIHYLEIGGAESALIGLLQTLDPDRVDVDLFLYDHRGELMSDIPSWVNVLPAIKSYTMLERPIKDVIKEGCFKIAWRRLIGKRKAYWRFKRSGSSLENYSVFFYAMSETNKVLPKINPDVEYDLAISFLTPHCFVLDNVNARKKIGWIHTDYSKIWLDVEEEWKMWSRLDRIVSISSDVTRTFCQVFPHAVDKIVEIENILSPGFILNRSKLIDKDYVLKEFGADGSVVFLTIGRFCHPKKMEEIPDILKLLREKGHDVRWYIIGFGDDSQIRGSISRTGMEDYVKILGKKTNPYPYIAACDFYVQPSRYEGKSITVREAQILGKPVIVTDYPTAKSQVKDGIDGFIVPMSIEDCATAIAEILGDRSKSISVEEYNSTHDFGNEAEVEKIYKLV